MVLNLFWCGLNYSKRSSKLFLTSCLSLDHHTPAAAPQHQPQQAELCASLWNILWPVELKTQRPLHGPDGTAHGRGMLADVSPHFREKWERI